MCYSTPRYVKDAGKLVYYFRNGNPPNAPHSVMFMNTMDNPQDTGGYSVGTPLIRNSKNSTTEPWSVQRPYVQSIPNGTDRIDFSHTDGHPGDIDTQAQGMDVSVYHFYMKWNPTLNKFQYFKSNGTEIVNDTILSTNTSQFPSLPIRPRIEGSTASDPTVVARYTNRRCWGWDIVIGADGRPRVLFTTFSREDDGPMSNNLTGLGYANHRYMFSRWTGTEWTTPTDICGVNTTRPINGTIRGVAVSGPGLATNNVNGSVYEEPCYSGGLCFDANDPNIVYLSKTEIQTTATNPALTVDDNMGIHEIQEWRTTDNGATWSKFRDITKNTPPTIINGRPYSPKNHNGKVAVTWWRGPYSTWWRGYNTNLWCAPSASQPIDASDSASIGGRFTITRNGQITPFGF